MEHEEKLDRIVSLLFCQFSV